MSVLAPCCTVMLTMILNSLALVSKIWILSPTPNQLAPPTVRRVDPLAKRMSSTVVVVVAVVVVDVVLLVATCRRAMYQGLPGLPYPNRSIPFSCLVRHERVGILAELCQEHPTLKRIPHGRVVRSLRGLRAHGI